MGKAANILGMEFGSLDRGWSVNMKTTIDSRQMVRAIKQAADGDVVTTTALRFNNGKPQMMRMLECFPKACEAVARVFEFGAVKYDDGNYKLGGRPDREYLDSLARHLVDLISGDVHDKDSGCHLIGHCIWNLAALYELNHSGEPAIDQNVFAARCEFWRQKKELEKRGVPVE